jgi:LDH2 family malate/lactate/ureidoglycolate dehydrogenase
MIDVLSGCLSGSATSPDICGAPDDPRPQRTGHFMAAIRVDIAGGENEFFDSLDNLAAAVHEAPRQVDCEQFQIPGEREHRAATQRRLVIPVEDGDRKLYEQLGRDFGVPFNVG